MTALFRKLLSIKLFALRASGGSEGSQSLPGRRFGFAGMASVGPMLGDSPMVVDTPMMVLFTLLAVLGGVSFGLIYRHMQEREERLGSRAQNAEEELRAMLTMTDDAVLVLDSTGTIRTVNNAAEELFGRAEDDFAGEVISSLIEHPLQLAALTKHGPANFDATALRGKEKVKVEVLLSQVQHAHGTSFLAMVKEKHAAAANLVAQDIGTQVSKHCHDLNNHLTGIVGHLSLILMSAQTDPAIHERLLNAKKNTLKAQDTSRKLQALARGDTPEPVPAGGPAPGTIVPMPIGASGGTGSVPANPRVLVLDDEESICALVATALSAQGVEVTEATTSEKALRACEEAMRNGKPFHLVIADLSMPNDLDGIETVKRLRAMDPNFKSVVSSGYDQDPIMNDYRKHGFDAALAKPYELHKLGRVVREILESSGDASRKTA